MTASFVEYIPATCEYRVNDHARRIIYQKKFMDFLTNRKPKLLKNMDGRAWLIMITENPTDTADTDYRNRSVTFQWTEIGDITREEDLYECSFIDVTEEWWNR